MGQLCEEDGIWIALSFAAIQMSASSRIWACVMILKQNTAWINRIKVQKMKVFIKVSVTTELEKKTLNV